MKKWLDDRREEIAEMGLFVWLFYAVLMIAFIILSLPFILFEALNECTKTLFGGVVE